jgi:hypothetical protein
MRQGHQNRRSRGRSRKGQNPLTRSFESTGPDVKIRGTPAHIAEKYQSLARDARSSGDEVLAENYLQHAEHYNRIIMAYREQQGPQPGEPINGSNGGRYPGASSADMDDYDDDGEMAESGQPSVSGFEPQPATSGFPARTENAHRDDRPRRNDRRQRNSDQRQGDSPRDVEVGFSDGASSEQGVNGSAANGAGRAEPQPASRAPSGEGPSRRPRRERYPSGEQTPEFLRRPVRRARSERGERISDDAQVPATADGPAGSDDGESGSD